MAIGSVNAKTASDEREMRKYHSSRFMTRGYGTMLTWTLHVAPSLRIQLVLLFPGEPLSILFGHACSTWPDRNLRPARFSK
jgi:hypothetical protein